MTVGIFSNIIKVILIIYASIILSDKTLPVIEMVGWENLAEINISDFAPNTIRIPKSFKSAVININNEKLPAYFNGRYYIFTATKSTDGMIEGETYLIEIYDKAVIKYNPEFMCGEDKMEDVKVRGISSPGIVEFTPVDTNLVPEKLPEGFREVFARLNGREVTAWTDDRYYIMRAVYNEYEDWYLFDTDNNMYIRYEPSFMTGKVSE